MSLPHPFTKRYEHQYCVSLRGSGAPPIFLPKNEDFLRAESLQLSPPSSQYSAPPLEICSAVPVPKVFQAQSLTQKVFKSPYSPKNSTAVTETQMAITGLDILSMKIGMDSTAAAFANKSVTNNKWCFSTNGKILLACCFSNGFPPLWRTFELRISNESKPMVRPDIKPKKQKTTILKAVIVVTGS